MLIDDHRDTCELYGASLEAMGFDVAVAHDATDGEAAVVATMPHVVVTDLRLPKRNGLELLARLKADPRLTHLPVVICSADAFPEARAHAMQAGCAAYLVKPCLPQALADTLRTVIFRRADF